MRFLAWTMFQYLETFSVCVKAFIKDDGELVTVDLHGFHLEKAEMIIRKSLMEAYYRGRDRIKFIHGSSTSSLQFDNSTIKFKVRTILQEATLQKMLTQVLPQEDCCIAAFKPDFEIDRSQISSIDIY